MADISLGGISLDGDEDDGLSFQVDGDAEAKHDLQLCLVGRFLTDRPIIVLIMKARMAGIWRPVKGVTIKEASPGLFLFLFFHVRDMEAVLRGGGTLVIRQPLTDPGKNADWHTDSGVVLVSCGVLGPST